MNKITSLDLKNKIAEIEFPEEILMIDNIMDGYKNYQILTVALKLELFEKMVEIGHSSPREIAEAASVNGMFIRSILSTLEDMGFVRSDEEGYSLTESAETFLRKKSPLYQGDMILSVGRGGSPWNDLKTLLERRGPPKISEELDDSQIRSRSQQCIRGELQSVLQGISSYPEFSKSQYLLDIGGSHGLYSIALCQNNSGLSATIIEQEQVVPLTASLVSEYGMEDRIEVQNGGIENLIGGMSEEGYDVILISHLLYMYRREIGEKLENVVQMLNPGGILVLNHRFCSPACDIKPGAGVREIDRALSSFGHPLCHPEGLKEVLENLGFLNVSLIPHETALGYAVLCIGIKEYEPPEKAFEEKIASNYPGNGDDKCC